MGDAMDMAFDSPEADEEANSVYNQICEEQGLGQMVSGDVGTGQIGVK